MKQLRAIVLKSLENAPRRTPSSAATGTLLPKRGDRSDYPCTKCDYFSISSTEERRIEARERFVRGSDGGSVVLEGATSCSAKVALSITPPESVTP